MRCRGLSLIEVVVALGLVALIIPLLVDLLPLNSLAGRRARDKETATSYAWKMLEEARLQPPTVTGVDIQATVELNGGEFEVRREIFEVDDRLVDVVVRVTPRGGRPVTLGTRLALSL